MTIRRIILLIALYTASAAMLWAGCKSDCKEKYQSEVDSCHLLHDEPDEADDLRMCLQDAKEQYDNCIEECDN